MRSLLRRSFVALAILIFSASVALAQNEIADAKSAVKNLYISVARADSAAIRQYLFVENDPQEELAKAYADLILAGKKLADSARKRYPGSPAAFAQGAILPEDAALIENADVKVTGDDAVIRFAGRTSAINVRRINGAWRVVMRQGADDSAEHRQRQLAMLAGMADAMNKSAEEIDANTYVKVEEAETAVKDRLGSVLAKALQDHPPTTEPAATQEAK